jgi:pyrroline-5-carboxylate reductase
LFNGKKIVFIGPGMMAEAMISGLIRKGVSQPDDLIAAGPRKERLDQLMTQYGIHCETKNAQAALVLSIVAGATIKRIQEGLCHDIVVRSMPNTPAQIAEGITVWTDSAKVSDEQREMTRQILGALGEEIYVEEEYYLNMATALSGTGPAYVFMFMEAMVDAGVHLGFPRRIAEQLVAKTVRGSVDYYRKRDVHLARLRNEVTSPGGTSAAALYYLEKAGFRTAISRAIWAAFERSRELGIDAKSHSPEPADTN